MKRITFLLLATVLLISSCKKENTPSQIDNNFNPSNQDSLIATGSFINEVHPTNGTVSLYQNDNEYTLSIENLQSDNGPDLRVYISADKGISNSVLLGELKAVSGNFSYTFPLTTDITNKDQVLIWCEDFSVLFGSAVIQ
jgi:hypothetical protein